MNEKQRIEEISSYIQDLLLQVDMFTSSLNKNDMELLNKAKDQLAKDISHKESAMVLISAMGGNYNSLEDRLKYQTLEILIQLINLRQKFLFESQEQLRIERIKNENLKALGF